MNNTPNRLSSPNNANNWSDIGAEIPFDERMARMRVQADKIHHAQASGAIELGPTQVDEYGNFHREWLPSQNSTETAESLAKTPVHRKAEIASFLLDDNQSLTNLNPFLGKNDIEQAYRTALGDQDGLITKEVDFVKQIDTPLGHNFENSQDVFSSLGYHELKILSHLSGVGSDNYKQSRAADLNTLVSRYSSPSTIIPRMNQLLNIIVNPAKAQQYAEDFESFGRKIYGERYEYSKAFDELYHDAEKYHLDRNWNIPANPGRPELLYTPENKTESQPLELSPYYDKTIDDKIEAEFAANRQRAAEEEEKNARLKSHTAKIVTSFITGQHVADIEKPVAGNGARETFYGWLNDGQLTTADEHALLQSLTAPVHFKNGFTKVYANLGSDYEQTILAFASGNGFGSNIPTTISDVETAFNQYPTPIEFQAVENAFLNNIHNVPGLPPEEVAKYQKAVDSFKNKIYGKRQQYHEAWQKLEQEAKSHQAHLQNLNEHYESSDMDYQSPEAQAYAEKLQQQFGSSSSEHSADRRVVIKSRDQDTADSKSKKGIFGKFFGRKG